MLGPRPSTGRLTTSWQVSRVARLPAADGRARPGHSRAGVVVRPDGQAQRWYPVAASGFVVALTDRSPLDRRSGEKFVYLLGG